MERIPFRTNIINSIYACLEADKFMRKRDSAKEISSKKGISGFIP